MKKIILFITLICFAQLSFACAEDVRIAEKNISLVKNMFANFSEKLNIAVVDNYYSKNFTLESNIQNFSYAQFKNIEQNIFKNLKSLKIVKYNDVFASGNKVVARMVVETTSKKNIRNTFEVYLIALIKNDKIERIWELTYPNWSDKLDTK